MKGKCIDCKHARQAGDKSRKDVVGCTMIGEKLSIYDISSDGNVYKGWYYSCRKVGDISDTKRGEFGRGALTNGYLVDSHLTCKQFEFFDIK